MNAKTNLLPKEVFLRYYSFDVVRTLNVSIVRGKTKCKNDIEFLRESRWPFSMNIRRVVRLILHALRRPTVLCTLYIVKVCWNYIMFLRSV